MTDMFVKHTYSSQNFEIKIFLFKAKGLKIYFVHNVYVNSHFTDQKDIIEI